MLYNRREGDMMMEVETEVMGSGDAEATSQRMQAMTKATKSRKGTFPSESPEGPSMPSPLN